MPSPHLQHDPRRDEEYLAAVVDSSISGRGVARNLTALIASRGTPGLIVSAHGTERASNAMLGWSQEAGLPWHFIALGKPMQNGICEGFNAKMCDEHLNETLFVGLDHARSAAARLTAMGNRLRHPEPLRRSHVAATTPMEESNPRTPASAG